MGSAGALRGLLGTMMFVSGAAALIYQVVWQRVLTLYYGVGFESIAIVVSVFMFGLGCGGLVGGWFTERIRTSVLSYLAVEVTIGIFGVLSLTFLGWLGALTAGAPPLVVALCSFAFLAVPTFLMGATLPIVITVFSRVEPGLLAGLSFFYFLNTLGAAVGAFFASYIAISFFGLDGAVYLAAAMNLSLGVLVLLVPAGRSLARATVAGTDSGVRLPVVYAAIFVAGFLAIGYQIVWMRLSGVMLKDSPYAFATTLGVYLLGLALGSAWLQSRAHALTLDRRKSLFFLLNFLIACAVLGTVVLFKVAAPIAPLRPALEWLAQHMVLPLFPGMPGAADLGASVSTLLATIAVPTVLMGIPVLLMGASFPLAASLVGDAGGRPGKAVGTAYFVNVMGNTAGALATGFVLLPAFGTEHTLGDFVVAGACFVLGVSGGQTRAAALRLALLVGVAATAIAFFPAKGDLYRPLHAGLKGMTAEYFEEGREGVVLVRQSPDLLLNFINGSSHGARPGPGYFNGVFTTLAYSPAPRRVLVVGFGAGSITEAALLDNRVEKITMVEVNGTLLRNLEKIPEISAILRDARVEVVVEDARRDLLRSDAVYDVVLMDPLRTTSSLSNNIYSREFLELVRRRMAPGAVVMAWTDNLTVFPRTVATAFDHVRFYRGACSFLIASTAPLREQPGVRQTLEERLPGSMRDAVRSLDCQRAGDRAELLRQTAAVPVNTDLRPYAEFYLRGYR